MSDPEAPDRRDRDDEEEPPPVLGSWGRLYALVIGALAVCIALLAILSRSFG